ncbi:DUF4184 family protein [Brevibacillus ginsengisoli]|uniref:DUF4184 family protein n=1 Tax=Brevibacillus ginsengisoli TaxID=363854 RepID=UPI003CF61F42
MPFTFSHTLYAAPLKWIKPKWFSLTGLVVGSMSPDFEYFIALEPYQSIGHTIQGLFFQAIPLSIIVSILFHKIIKKPLIMNLPFSFHFPILQTDRLWKQGSVAQWVVFLCSVIIGFFTHLFVDSFTHVGGFFVMHSQILRTSMLGLPVYKWLQYSLSLFGLLFPVAWLMWKRWILLDVRQFRGLRTTNRKIIQYWFLVLLVSVVTLLLKLLLGYHGNLIGVLVVAPITGGLIGILAASVVYR